MPHTGKIDKRVGLSIQKVGVIVNELGEMEWLERKTRGETVTV